MKKKLMLLFLVLCLIAAAVYFFRYRPRKSGAPSGQTAVPADTLAMLAHQVQRCSRLYATEYQIHKLITHSEDKQLKGKFLSIPVDLDMSMGDRKIAIPIDVTIKSYIDFSNFSVKNIRRSDSSICIILPPPVIIATASKIDHKNVRQYIDLMRSPYSEEEMLGFARQGEDSVLKNIDKRQIMNSAEQSATALLMPILRHLGYQNLNAEIAFSPSLTPDRVKIKIIKN